MSLPVPLRRRRVPALKKNIFVMMSLVQIYLANFLIECESFFFFLKESMFALIKIRQIFY